MNVEDEINPLGILAPSDHALSSSLKIVFEVDAVPQFRDLLKALDSAEDCNPSDPQPDFPVIKSKARQEAKPISSRVALHRSRALQQQPTHRE